MEKLAFTLLILFILTTFGCAKSNEKATPEIRQAHTQLEGSLANNAAKLLNGSFRAKCDETIEPMRQEIAAALEARESQILALTKNTSASEIYKSVPFGPMHVRQTIKPIAPKEGWIENKTSWIDIVADYKKIKGTPTDDNWRILNSTFRGALLDDVTRIVKGVNYQITKDNFTAIGPFFMEIKACNEKQDCLAPALTAEASTFLDSQIRYREEFNEIAAAKSNEDKRAEIKDLLEWVEVDYKFVSFSKNPNVKLLAPNHFELPIDFGQFAPVADQLNGYFNALWQVEGNKVSLKAQSSREPLDVFRMLLGDQVGGRSFMSYVKRTVTFMPSTIDRTIPHELGHVLGFKDNYFDVWNPANCEWVSQFREDDLMSDHSTGKVLDLHWAKLAEEYK